MWTWLYIYVCVCTMLLYISKRVDYTVRCSCNSVQLNYYNRFSSLAVFIFHIGQRLLLLHCADNTHTHTFIHTYSHTYVQVAHTHSQVTDTIFCVACSVVLLVTGNCLSNVLPLSLFVRFFWPRVKCALYAGHLIVLASHLFTLVFLWLPSDVVFLPKADIVLYYIISFAGSWGVFYDLDKLLSFLLYGSIRQCQKLSAVKFRSSQQSLFLVPKKFWISTDVKFQALLKIH